jgi:hypothetical protein
MYEPEKEKKAEIETEKKDTDKTLVIRTEHGLCWTKNLKLA